MDLQIYKILSLYTSIKYHLCTIDYEFELFCCIIFLSLHIFQNTLYGLVACTYAHIVLCMTGINYKKKIHIFMLFYKTSKPDHKYLYNL